VEDISSDARSWSKMEEDVLVCTATDILRTATKQMG